MIISCYIFSCSGMGFAKNFIQEIGGSGDLNQLNIGMVRKRLTGRPALIEFAGLILDINQFLFFKHDFYAISG